MDESRQILDAIDRWLKRDVAPKAAKLEHDDVWPKEMVEQMRTLGLFGATISPQYGGLGLSAEVYARIVARISEVWMSLTGIFNSHLMMALLVEKFGSSYLKEKYLPKFATGEIRGGLALTEPNAGTDLQAIRMRAERHQDLDLERHRGLVLRGPRQDRSGRRAAPSRHDALPLRERPGLYREPPAREARLQGHRRRRARVPRLPRQCA